VINAVVFDPVLYGIRLAAPPAMLVAEETVPDTSEPEIVPHVGAADDEPVPVCTKKFLVVVVLPDNLANEFEAFE
jgi:hypothetical protein